MNVAKSKRRILPITAAAVELGDRTVSRLRREVAAGCPVARRGKRGGDVTLIDVDAHLEWRARERPDADWIIAAANRLHETIATANAVAVQAITELLETRRDSRRIERAIAIATARLCWELGVPAMFDVLLDAAPPTLRAQLQIARRNAISKDSDTLSRHNDDVEAAE